MTKQKTILAWHNLLQILASRRCYDEADYATYDASDDKIRIYTDRVPRPMYDEFRAQGWGRAYKQGCFFAKWSPVRHDLALLLCGEIGDEDTTIFERAEDRADRFATYSTNAGVRSEQASAAAHDAVKGIELGQPIMVGSGGEKAHRRAVASAQRNTQKALDEHDKSDWWRYRANGVRGHAAYKFKPGVILRRLKKLAAEKRKQEKAVDEFNARLDWTISDWLRDNTPLNENHLSMREQTDNLSDEQRSALKAHIKSIRAHIAAWAARWIEHLDGLIIFWTTVYEDGEQVPADKNDWDIKVGGWVRCYWGWGQVKRVNKRNGTILSVSLDKDTMPSNVPWKVIPKREEILDYNPDRAGPVPVVEYNKPEPGDDKRAELVLSAKEAQDTRIETVRVPDFFPTSNPSVLARMFNLALIKPGDRFLEPSAGGGDIARVAKTKTTHVFCCELDYSLRQALILQGFSLVGSDFLKLEMFGRFDVIVMNPPFSGNQAIEHITHAFRMLKPGGRLVSVAGQNIKWRTQKAWVGFRAWLDDAGGWIEDLPDESFKSVGTNVKTCLVYVDKEKRT